ncbi:hypothetical protein TTHERM_001013368 (macronuclear) [Tetrahymena thermophila SB210]|uniref:Uncharacterized protein n=1 Tax=Tetrahymena thermophila (strain SB210) TaxID=312017 RepID=W7XLR6_TETTS|nr:hypothetical protein TTHERM_001013368 [Tetrahymena thermophila SB210]EWS76754.1 hypothetical protein TTHERM_001013368 [Tetrahymena thermophila SB210]|eukprot:XP_012650716.1 hypothetical protein TTHERM_001013368 [Tetrahymena thermophila SB210]
MDDYFQNKQQNLLQIITIQLSMNQGENYNILFNQSICFLSNIHFLKEQLTDSILQLNQDTVSKNYLANLENIFLQGNPHKLLNSFTTQKFSPINNYQNQQ